MMSSLVSFSCDCKFLLESFKLLISINVSMLVVVHYVARNLVL
jgi:hypothetical protein